jgi:hypothetical protein
MSRLCSTHEGGDECVDLWNNGNSDVLRVFPQSP